MLQYSINTVIVEFFDYLSEYLDNESLGNYIGKIKQSKIENDEWCNVNFTNAVVSQWLNKTFNDVDLISWINNLATCVVIDVCVTPCLMKWLFNALIFNLMSSGMIFRQHPTYIAEKMAAIATSKPMEVNNP